MPKAKTDETAELRQRVAALEATVARLTSGAFSLPLVGGPAGPRERRSTAMRAFEASSGEGVEEATPHSRRDLLKLAGAAAAGAAGGLALRALPASAATGGNMVLGQTNDAGATTELVNSTGLYPAPLLSVQGATSTAAAFSANGGGPGSPNVGVTALTVTANPPGGVPNTTGLSVEAVPAQDSLTATGISASAISGSTGGAATGVNATATSSSHASDNITGLQVGSAGGTNGLSTVIGAQIDAKGQSGYTSPLGIGVNAITPDNALGGVPIAINATAQFGTSPSPLHITDPTGVQGTAEGSASAAGISGTSDIGFGVYGASSQGVDVAAAGAGRIFQAPFPGTVPPSYNPGTGFEQIRDGNGVLWLSGIGTNWRRVNTVIPITPVRVVDTRNGTGGHTGALAAGSTTNFGPFSQIPSDAVGIIANLTAANFTGAGWLAIFPASNSWPGNSSVNFTNAAGISAWANMVTVALGAPGAGFGKVSIRVSGGVSSHAILDLVAYIQ